MIARSVGYSLGGVSYAMHLVFIKLQFINTLKRYIPLGSLIIRYCGK